MQYYQPIKGCKSIYKSKWHHHELVQPRTCTERDLVDVTQINPKLMIFALQFSSTIVGRALKLIKDIFNLGHQKLVLNGILI